MSGIKRSPVNGQPLPEGRRFTSESAREMQKRSIVSQNKKREKLKTLHEELEIVLSEVRSDKNGNAMTVQAGITTSLVKAALDGNTRAYEIIRDTIGQKPVEKVEVLNADYSALDEVMWDE